MQGKKIGVWTQLATRTGYTPEILDLFEQAAIDMEDAGKLKCCHDMQSLALLFVCVLPTSIACFQLSSWCTYCCGQSALCCCVIGLASSLSCCVQAPNWCTT